MTTIRDYMTASPHTVGRDQSLSSASEMMREHACRHLPVLHGGQLVGILSDRDVYLLETLEDVDETKVTVEEAMTQVVYAVPPDASLKAVVEEMASHKYGAAVIMEGKTVVGIFTTIDALRALSARL